MAHKMSEIEQYEQIFSNLIFFIHFGSKSTANIKKKLTIDVHCPKSIKYGLSSYGFTQLFSL